MRGAHSEDLIKLPFCIEGHCNRWDLYWILYILVVFCMLLKTIVPEDTELDLSPRICLPSQIV